MDNDSNVESSPVAAPNAAADQRERVPFGVWLMGGIFAVGLIVLIVMSSIDL